LRGELIDGRAKMSPSLELLWSSGRIDETLTIHQAQVRFLAVASEGDILA